MLIFQVQMPTPPFSVYTISRPLRFALLIDEASPGAIAQMDAWFEYCLPLWGGRYNPIIFGKSSGLQPQQWKFLNNFDPDILKTFIEFEQEPLEQISRMPLLEAAGEDKRDRRDTPHIEFPHIQHPLRIYPFIENVRKVAEVFQPVIVNFQLYDNIYEHGQHKYVAVRDKNIERFINLNFGSSKSDTVNRLYSGEVKTLPVVDMEGLITGLRSALSIHRHTFLNQLAALPNSLPEVVYQQKEDEFFVVVGDSPADIAFFWNSIHFTDYHDRTRLFGIWLPTAFLHEENLVTQLSQLISKYGDPYGQMNKSVKFISLSLEEQALRDLCAPLQLPHLRVSFKKYDEIKAPEYEYVGAPNPLASEAVLNRLGNEEDYLSNHIPAEFNPILGNSRHHHWMVDTYVEFRPDFGIEIYGRDGWWKYPAKNIIAQAIFPKTFSRIRRNHIPSVLVNAATKNFPFKFINEDKVFDLVLSGRTPEYYTGDIRISNPYGFFSTIHSNQGKYFNGFIELFGGFLAAHHYLERPLWRRIFNLFTRQKPQTIEGQLKSTKDKIRKAVKRQSDLSTEEGIEWLAHQVLFLSKRQPHDDLALPITRLLREVKTEVNNFRKQEGKRVPPFSINESEYQAELENELHILLSRGVLFMGLIGKCDNCGLKNWYQVDELKQIVECTGCRSQLVLSPEQTWHYKLNSLIVTGYRFSLTPLILALHDLWQHYQTCCFYFSPSRSIKAHSSSAELTDLDIVCIREGKLIIGEVKESCSLFDKKELNKLKDIAIKLRPDVLCFTALEQTPSEAIKKELQHLKEELKAHDVEVMWLQLHNSIFSPFPPMPWQSKDSSGELIPVLSYSHQAVLTLDRADIE